MKNCKAILVYEGKPIIYKCGKKQTRFFMLEKGENGEEYYKAIPEETAYEIIALIEKTVPSEEIEKYNDEWNYYVARALKNAIMKKLMEYARKIINEIEKEARDLLEAPNAPLANYKFRILPFIAAAGFTYSYARKNGIDLLEHDLAPADLEKIKQKTIEYIKELRKTYNKNNMMW